MEIARKNKNAPRPDRGKTVRDLLAEHDRTSHLLTERACGKPVSIIILCDGAAPFDEGALGAIPHVAVDLDDDLLQKIRELHKENLKLRSFSLIDNLTGLSNNRFLWMQLEIEMARTKRTGLSCTLMMIDLDNFKLLNDAFGHLEGDRFLAEFGRIMRDNSRATDMICRYGGDEFAVIMPATTVAEALKTGERFRKMLGDMPQKTDPPISLSIGISEYTALSAYGMNEFIHAADTAMYKAKKGGKNGICIDDKWEKAASGEEAVSPDEKEALMRFSAAGDDAPEETHAG